MSKPSPSSVPPQDALTQDTPAPATPDVALSTASATDAVSASPVMASELLTPIVPRLSAITPPPKTTGPGLMLASSPFSSRWTGVWSCVPALLFLALAAGLQNSPTPPLAVEPAPLADARVAQETVATGVLPSSETMVVSAKHGSGYNLMQAELQPTSQVTGQSPLSGQISRVLVRRGQFVDVNDRVLELSTGPTSRLPTGAERQQNSAESAQVAAVHQQEALNKRMETARAQLNEAQVRVAAARHRLLLARQLVMKVQNGEAVHLPASSAATDQADDTPATRRSAPRHRRATQVSAQPTVQDPRLKTYRLALQDAQHEAKKTQQAAAQATSSANAARLAADASDQKVRLKQHQLDDATTASDKMQDAFDSGQAKGSDVATARANLSNAKAALTEAAANAAHAHQEAERLQTVADKLQDEAKHTATRLAQASQKMEQVAAATPTHEVPAPEATTEPTTKPTTGHGEREADAGKTVDIAAVAQYVHEAKAESEAAVKNADRLKSEIDTYEKQVHSTTQRLDSTSKNLEAAQQTVVENTIHAGLSSVRAPASGVVLSVAEIAHDVSSGEPVVTIGRMDRLEARFEDYSGTWKNLKVGTLLPAVVREPATPPATAPDADDAASDMPDTTSRRGLRHHLRHRLNKTMTSATQSKLAPAISLKAKSQLPSGLGVKTLPGAAQPPAPRLATAATRPTVEGTPIRVRLTSVTPPNQPGAPAVLRVSIYNPRTSGAETTDESDAATKRGNGRLFHAGMTVLCSLQSPSTHEVVTVPTSAVLQASDGTRLVAVLKPVDTPSAPSVPAAAATPPPAAATAPTAGVSGSSSALPAPALTNAPAAPGTVALPGATPLSALAALPTPSPAEGTHRVEWRPVTLGKTDGIHLEIVDGLASGERIALEPAALHAFALAHGPGATLRLSTS